MANNRLRPITNFPQLVEEFHPTKNPGVDISTVGYQSRGEIWWKCQNGHEWLQAPQRRFSAEVKDRVIRCLQCRNAENLASEYPELVRQWHPTLNLKHPSEYKSQSNARVWWRCEFGHEWQSIISNRIKYWLCPFCTGYRVTPEYNFETSHPDLAREWHPTLNDGLKPCDVFPKSNKKVWWLCPNNHAYSCLITHRIIIGTSCQRCNSFEFLYPEIVSEWHPDLNGDLLPKNVSFGSRKKIYWQCPKVKEHVWRSEVHYRTMGYLCPYCNIKSKGEFAINKLLNELGVDYQREFAFEDCRDRIRLRFDFAVFPHTRNLGVIEFQGQQHYHPIAYWGGEKTLKLTQKRDKIKQTYCLENQIPQLIISYDADQSIEEAVLNFVENLQKL